MNVQVRYKVHWQNFATVFSYLSLFIDVLSGEFEVRRFILSILSCQFMCIYLFCYFWWITYLMDRLNKTKYVFFNLGHSYFCTLGLSQFLFLLFEMPRSKRKVTSLKPKTDNVIKAIEKVMVQQRSIRQSPEECYVWKYLIALDRIKNIYQTCFDEFGKFSYKPIPLLSQSTRRDCTFRQNQVFFILKRYF